MADPQRQEFWKFVVQHRKKNGVDETDFLKWYKEELMPECVRLLKKHNIPRFSVLYTPSAVRNPQKDEMDKLEHAKGTVPDWDVTTHYWVHSPEDVKRFHDDPEWISKAAIPALEWIDPNVHVSFGPEIVYLAEGKVMNLSTADGSKNVI